MGTGYRDKFIDAGDWGLVETARPLVAALFDASVGSTAFLLRQLLGRRAMRVSIPLVAGYEMDDPAVMDRLNTEARSFATNGLSAIRQPDGTSEDLRNWLAEYWH